MHSLPILNLTILVATCFGVPAKENHQDALPVSTNIDQKTAVGIEESFSDGSTGDLSQASQNSFYPSYSPFQNQPSGHSRPYYYNQQEAAYSQRPYFNNYDQTARFSGYKDINPAPKTDQVGLLGSGNFGVIPGGTFYNDNDNEESSNYGDYDSYFHNGHGRPSVYYPAQSNPKPYTQEQFSNFRDFADINTPQYSQYVVVYAPKNKNKTETDEDKQKLVPRNIIESLTLLDFQVPTTTEKVPEKKLSKSKRKLAQLPPEKKHLQKSQTKLKSKDLDEPLIALS